MIVQGICSWPQKPFFDANLWFRLSAIICRNGEPQHHYNSQCLVFVNRTSTLCVFCRQNRLPQVEKEKRSLRELNRTFELDAIDRMNCLTELLPKTVLRRCGLVISKITNCCCRNSCLHTWFYTQNGVCGLATVRSFLKQQAMNLLEQSEPVLYSEESWHPYPDQVVPVHTIGSREVLWWWWLVSISHSSWNIHVVIHILWKQEHTTQVAKPNQFSTVRCGLGFQESHKPYILQAH